MHNIEKEIKKALRFDDGKPDYLHIHPTAWDALVQLAPHSPAFYMNQFMNHWFYQPGPTLPSISNPQRAQIVELATPVLEFGATKYAAGNYTFGMKYSRVMKSFRRHIFALARGEAQDPESGLGHVGHAACNVIFAFTYSYLGFDNGEFDDRGEYKFYFPGAQDE